MMVDLSLRKWRNFRNMPQIERPVRDVGSKETLFVSSCSTAFRIEDKDLTSALARSTRPGEHTIAWSAEAQTYG